MTQVIRRLHTASSDFHENLDRLLSWDEISDRAVVETVAEIIQQVRLRGDDAVVEFTNRFDRRELSDLKEARMDRAQLFAALNSLAPEERTTLQAAADRIRSYHEHQKQESWNYKDEFGNLLGQRITPIQKVGVYVPGGKATLFSSALMNAIPAQVAGVETITMVTPAPNGIVNPMVLAAAALAGVEAVFTIGGAQAVAALALGTTSIPRVDKIVGPGNIYVATAKRQLYGLVGLDMVAGPSEILVVSDGKTDPDWLAMDLFSQAEHDESAQSILISWDQQHLDDVEQSIQKLLPDMERSDIIRASLRSRGALIRVANLDEALDLVNRIGPEHLELAISEAESYLDRIQHAGAIFLGRYTPEAVGDYCAGPNHVLPTSGTARFSSPLGVYDFQKRSSIIGCSAQGGAVLGAIASKMARGEALTAHARSAEYRLKGAE